MKNKYAALMVVILFSQNIFAGAWHDEIEEGLISSVRNKPQIGYEDSSLNDPFVKASGLTCPGGRFMTKRLMEIGDYSRGAGGLEGVVCVKNGKVSSGIILNIDFENPDAPSGLEINVTGKRLQVSEYGINDLRIVREDEVVFITKLKDAFKDPDQLQVCARPTPSRVKEVPSAK